MRHLKWLAYLMTAVMLFCLVPDTSATAASALGECVTPTGVYRSHLWSAWRTEKEATCKETGLRTRRCQRCGETERETIPKKSHSYGAWTVTKEATCSSAGEETRKCSVCGLVHTRAIPADPEAHVFGPWQTVKAATASQSGLMRRVCTLCGAEKEETIPPGSEGAGDVTPSPGGKAGICAITLTGDDGQGKEGLLSLLITNTGEDDLTHVCLDVQLQGEDGVSHMERLLESSDEVIAPGDSMSCDFAYLPGQEEVGFTFVAAAESVYGGRMCTAVFFYDGPAAGIDMKILMPDPEVTVTKSVDNEPPEGQGAFRENDTIRYWSVITNDLGYAISGKFYDRVDGYGDIFISDVTVESEANCGVSFDYTVSHSDAEAGEVTDRAVFIWSAVDPAGRESGETETVSPPVTVPLETVKALTLVKEEDSSSLDPNGYALNETVKFKITLHNGLDYPVAGALWDEVSSLDDPTDLGTFSIGPGETQVFEYSYVVRQPDVDNGYFDNIAYAEVLLYSLIAGTRGVETIWSNEVRISVIKPQPKTTAVPATMCRRVLTAYGSEGGIYECTFCDTHLAVEQKVRGLGAAEAKTVWTAAVNSLYDEMAAKYPGRTAQLAENDRTLFFAQLDLYEKMLIEAYGADVAGEMILDELRDRCIDLCYALHTVPQARKDSVLRLSPTLKTSGVMPAECVRTRRKNGAGFTLTETLCVDHGYIGYVPDAASPGEEDFSWIRRLWEAALTSETAALRGATPAKAKEAVSAFLAWTAARGELLKALYNDGAVAEEVLVFTVRGRTLDLERNKQ